MPEIDAFGSSWPMYGARRRAVSSWVQPRSSRAARKL